MILHHYEMSRLVHKPEKDLYHHLEELKKAGKVRLLRPICARTSRVSPRVTEVS